MQIVKQLENLRQAVDELRTRGKIALIPTMGALHEGHLSLVQRAQKSSQAIVVSIFVNPTQFGEGEDLDSYPRQLEKDAALLEAAGVDLIWAPDVAAIYPDGFATGISVSGVSEGLCGASRPGHFDGVATIVAKLFNQVRPDLAVFGEKDWQQLAVIRTMTRDLDFTLPHADQIIGAPTKREGDGLAMSSRNRYLSIEDRASAAALPRAMKAAIAAIGIGGNVDAALDVLRATLLNAGFNTVDYAELVDAQSLEPLTTLIAQHPARLILAARIGGTRLIDNMAVTLK